LKNNVSLQSVMEWIASHQCPISLENFNVAKITTPLNTKPKWFRTSQRKNCTNLESQRPWFFTRCGYC
jgi:hypothetical protein